MKQQITNRWAWVIAITIIFVSQSLVGINELKAEKVKERAAEKVLTDPGVEGTNADPMFVNFTDTIIDMVAIDLRAGWAAKISTPIPSNVVIPESTTETL